MPDITDDDVRLLFDMAIGSMEFGSGLLDDEEVLQLRRIAVRLGVDPDEATPYNFRNHVWPE
jgi:hypothetical protein